MTSLAALTLPNFEVLFDVTTDASNLAIGAVLSQHDRPISFYRKDNKVADALSRVEEVQLLALSSTDPTWWTDLRNFYRSPEGQQLITKLRSSDNQFQLRDGLIYINNKLFIPDDSSIRRQLLEEYHSTTLGGHSGILATTRRIAATFHWSKLKENVRSFIRECRVCQETKYPTHKPYGLLQPIPIPSQVWNDISMDFITHLPPSAGKTVIWVVVDRFSKFAHFVGLPTKFTAMSLATTFMQSIYKLHGLPRSIISDRDPIFLSSFWRELFKQVGTRLNYSTAYHPQSDGQTEVVNRCLQNYLRAFASDEPQSWHRFLYLAEYWYNTSHHSAINMSPFQALYGRPIPDLNRYMPGSSSNASIDLALSEHNRLRSLLQDNLRRAQQRMTALANSHRIDKQFAIGDMVYLRLRDYRQHSVQSRSSKKLNKRFYGPFKILDKIGAVAYRLDLPPSSRVHPVFHVSLLRQAFGNPTPTPLPDFCYNPELEDELNVQGRAIDTDQEPNTTGPPEDSPQERPKRTRKLPARLRD
ncbi:hypothetical protein L2E82_29829 [Cichorium intybus]|uniref:Uncharacterized protein n=1 Tax=Cichorium intybus TaxID=13427 RepID=A0ACB9CYP6_CICIN|nr:hypothetical protein L2E82_29829 [Cichorium intybus]